MGECYNLASFGSTCMMLRPVILAMHLDNKLMGSHNFLSVSSLCDKRVDQLKKA